MTLTRRSCSSSFTYVWTYDVFLNFRGEDTRTGFTGNLYNALRQRGIDTFIDDEELKRGEEITPALIKAIKDSRIGIIVFSKNYASSTYCLDELVEILELIKGRGRLVWPIFYDVEPSQVRHQIGSYGEALAKHEERFKENKDKVKKWRLALSQAANLSGWQLKNGNEYEYVFIGRIIEEVSKKVSRIPLHITNYPVGLEARVQEVNSLLDLGFDKGVIMVGICGIGGIGKTTITRALYNLIGDEFESLCFLADVREISNKHGLLHLQETLLLQMFREKDIKLGDVNKGIPLIKRKLHQKKVLLILDDVDKLEQLQAIAGKSDWFGSGSRIVITTRDKHLLANHGVEIIYDVKGLNHEEALQLFSWNAFNNDKVDSSYMDISSRAVLYTCGHPLALEVIGSNFFGKSIHEWNSALDKYERIPNKKILKVLKLSYDALEEDEKEIFLDVACFFRGDRLGDVIDMLQSARGILPDYAIGVLIDKSFIKVQCDHVIMHDLIQDMGREIVRQESRKEPGNRSRLWLYEDILHVLQANTGTNKIEVIILDLPKNKEVHWSGEAFKKMKNLKMLIVRNASFSRGPKHLPNSLRVLDWKQYPSMFLPSNFHPVELVKLNLANSHCVLLKPMIKNYKNLIHMNFSNCKFLKQVPDLSGVPNLIKLCLDSCTSLTEIHDSIGFLDKLKQLSAERCTKLQTFPRGIKLTSLECLRFSWCSSLQSFPEVLEKMEKITELSLPGTGIEELPFSICNLIGLEILNLVECRRLKRLPTSILMLPRLWILSAQSCGELRYFDKNQGEGQEQVCSMLSPNMKFLNFWKCNLSDDSLPICLSCFPNLLRLDLSYNNFTILPACIKECHFLRELSVDYCKQLQEIASMPPKIEAFKAKNCTSLTTLFSSTLLNQAFHKPGNRNFILPGDRVPQWFEHYSEGESVSFWVRKEFPAIVVCVVVGVLDDKDCTFSFKLSVRINGTDQKFYSDQGLMSTLEIDHIFLCDLQNKLPKGELQEVLLLDQWNHVQVLCMNDSWIRLKGGIIKWIGVQIYKQESDMDNIRFTDPTLAKRTYHDLRNSNNDWELNCSPSPKKQRSSPMRLRDFEIQDIHQQRFLTLINPIFPTCCGTVSRHKEKDTIGDNEGSASDCLPMKTPWNIDTICDQERAVLDNPAKGQPQCQVTRFHETPNLHAPTTTASSDKVTEGGIHQETSCISTVENIEMEAFYASLDTTDSSAISPSWDTKVIPELAKTRPSEETQEALQTLQHFLSEDFSISLLHGHHSTMKTTLDHLSKLSAYDGVSEEMRSLILQVSREFACWSWDFEEASKKIELTTAKMVKVDELEEGLGVNKKNFDQVVFSEKEVLYQLAYLQERKKELEVKINDIKDSIFVSQSAKDTVGKRKREIFDIGKTLKAQRDELRRQMPYLRDERESAKQRKAKIRVKWSKLGEKFNKSMKFWGL